MRLFEGFSNDVEDCKDELYYIVHTVYTRARTLKKKSLERLHMVNHNHWNIAITWSNSWALKDPSVLFQDMITNLANILSRIKIVLKHVLYCFVYFENEMRRRGTGEPREGEVKLSHGLLI